MTHQLKSFHNARIYFISMLLLFPILAWGQWSSDPESNTPICTAIDDQNETRILSDGLGGAFVAWRDYRNDPSIFICSYGRRKK